MERLLEWNPITRTKRTWIEQPDGNVVINNEQDCTDIADLTAAQRAATDERAKMGDMAPAYRVPLSILFQLEATGITRDDKAFLRWLRDPANSKWRLREKAM
jgi:hypothetical protein